MTAPNMSQLDRDALDDLGVVQVADRIGTGPHANHSVEAVAQ